MSGFLTGRTSMFKVQTADIAADAVTAAKLPDDVIDSEHYTDGSIDNAHIADDAIDSEHYATGSIDSAHLADDAVTLAKMVAGTDGVIITYDASGNPVHVGPGSDGEVLTSTGSGSPPAFEAAASGPSQANQAALEAETNEDTYAPPDLMVHHPGVASAFADCTQAGALGETMNITSATDGGTGLTTITIAANMDNALCSALISNHDGSYNRSETIDNASGASFVTRMLSSSAGSLNDSDTDFSISLFGDRA